MTATEEAQAEGQAEPSLAERLGELLTEEFGDRISTVIQWDQLTVDVDADGYVDVARFMRDDPRFACDFFDWLSAVDERADGFAVVASLYSTEHQHRVLVRHHCAGGREDPTAPSLTDLWEGANWHERETWDMFGIEFEGHPGLAPRILTTENFEGWPLRKDFYLATREAKPWPGIKEPLELDEEGNPIERVRGQRPGEAPGPMSLDEAMAEQAKRAAGLLDEEQVEIEGEADEAAPDAPHTTAPEGEAVQAAPKEEASARAERARRKAAELRRKKREEAGEAEPDQGLEDTPAQERRDEEAEASQDTGHDSAAAEGQGGPPGVPPEPGAAQEQGTTPDASQPREHTGGEGAGSQPEQLGDEAAPGAEAGEPPDTQAPGEASVEGGMRETVEEEADAGAGPAGGERPDTEAGDDSDDGDET